MPALDDFVSEDAFERVCQAWLGEHLGAAEVGWWWGSIRRQELDKLETVRDELGATDADLYFFDRVGFSPRLRELAERRDDVKLVLAAQLGQS